MTRFVPLAEGVIHCLWYPGAAGRRAVVLANSLGTDLRIWDEVANRLPPEIPLLRYDKRGHGLSDLGPAALSAHVDDLAALMGAFGLRGALVCGVSVGGMIAQGLAAAHPGLVAGLMLCNTAPRIGDAAGWNDRIARIESAGIESMAAEILARWFSGGYRARHPEAVAGWRNMLVRTPTAGYAATCAAIRDADLTAATRALRLPVLCLAGQEDGATPPELVRAMAELVPGAGYRCLDGVGHLPPIEAPEAVAGLLLGHYVALP